ncbi:double-strand break repair protein AddB [Aestuariibius sp. 2305UL40-4]|uniref:double-strand break repair protein AddB n=1 Tax=Aestuariibius violaceus TaxID=3234132 RepID=UPI00345EAD56
MFPPQEGPRVFGLPPGVDFPVELIAGLRHRLSGQRPDAMGRVELIVNTRRMQRRLRECFDAGPAGLLPRIRLLTDIADDPALGMPPPAPGGLKRRLEVARLVSTLIEQEPDLAGRQRVFDLADSLVALIDEMRGEGVGADDIVAVDVSDASGHWERALKFVRITERFLGETSDAPDPETRLRKATETLVARWQTAPPRHPVILAGSTGSRSTTALLMRAVAHLPQGALVLPGVDFDMPARVWDRLGDALTAEDHPQYRFRRLADDLGLDPAAISRWTAAEPPSPPRNALVSLALRPAPVTDDWIADGQNLTDLEGATAAMTLIEAPTPRIEAAAIALRLRKAAETGQTAALITPDRTLARQVTAALDRWRITPDDSAGEPLHLTAPGRFLRHVAEAMAGALDAEALLTLLKHPLANSGGEGRGDHLRLTRDLELHLRRKGLTVPRAADITAWASDDTARAAWAGWVIGIADHLPENRPHPLADLVTIHRRLADDITAGPSGDGATLWTGEAGEAAAALHAELAESAPHGGPVRPADFAELLTAILSRANVRRTIEPHPQIRIWGTLEARVQGCDLVILGGLNDGTWPERPAPDPWFNRAMRLQAGLLLPERRIGLSAHDFQQAICAPEVWLSRSLRSDDAETVPSRWLNRLTNLLDGLHDQNGPDALKAMRSRGRTYVGWAEALDRPAKRIHLAPRPSPQPPVDLRPRKLSVTRIRDLIRDPYAIYARSILRLRPLDPLSARPDALLRGIVLHEILHQFIARWPYASDDDARKALTDLAGQILADHVPGEATRALWHATLDRTAEAFIDSEHARQARGTPALLEKTGQATIPGLNVTLTAKADRIDRTGAGAAILYDYKSGTPPTKAQQKVFDKQLLLEAAILQQGGFPGFPAGAVIARADYISLRDPAKVHPAPLNEEPPDKTWDGFCQLMARWADRDRGYTARLAMEQESAVSDYDHLSRFGEWDLSDRAKGDRVG